VRYQKRDRRDIKGGSPILASDFSCRLFPYFEALFYGLKIQKIGNGKSEIGTQAMKMPIPPCLPV